MFVQLVADVAVNNMKQLCEYVISDVTKLVKIRIRRMQISTFKIRRMWMQMSLDKHLFYHLECNTLVYVNEMNVTTCCFLMSK